MRGMIRAKDGRIVAIGSVAAPRRQSGQRRLCGLEGRAALLLRTLAVETAKRGITVNVVAPGFIDTDMMAPMRAYSRQHGKPDPGRRFAKPEEIAGLAAFLLSPPAAYITGAVLPIDGGLTAMIGIHR